MNMRIMSIVLAMFTLIGCSENNVSFSTAEDMRAIAKENATFNAQLFRNDNATIEGWSIMARGDSTIDETCPMGDGWASVDYISPDKKNVYKAKCSTVSSQISCMSAPDFQARSNYSSKENHCQRTIPMPLPKLNK